MSNEVLLAIIAAVSTGFGIVATKAFEWFQFRSDAKTKARQQAIEDTRTDTQVAVGIYKDMLVDLRKDAAQLVETMHARDEEHLVLREQMVTLRVEKAKVEVERDQLRIRLTFFEKPVAQEPSRIQEGTCLESAVKLLAATEKS